MEKQGKLTQNNVHLRPHEYKTIEFLLDRGIDVELVKPSQIKRHFELSKRIKRIIVIKKDNTAVDISK